MSTPVSLRRPSPLQYLAYCYGRTLPPSMNDWVRNDLAGPGAGRRTVVRVTIPVIVLLAPLLLFPTTPLVLASMTLPIVIPFVYFAIALNKIYRAARLKRHGLDPEAVDELARRRDERMHREYAARFGR
ncbi:DUF5313 domain-containing protein [Speluncibacter jeojiensis]|uniref:DUF5313 domain-containing protein n=1 Tax=Speluncibacter jeojiensis TaxID=2710754 RepID=A0A9X4M1C6_9ACTN|nr:DUF5313 domain-containing protein [Corynebacteriales bacterium D3-21]